MVKVPEPRFDLGTEGVVATPGALELLEEHGVAPATLIRRHHHGDWGNVSEGDRELNERSLETGDRLMSSYSLGEDGDAIWVITEAVGEDGRRSVTTILRPSDY